LIFDFASRKIKNASFSSCVAKKISSCGEKKISSCGEKKSVRVAKKNIFFSAQIGTDF